MNDFIKEEIRNDFLVDSKRKKIWKIELDLYMELERVCQKHSLKLFAGAGTCLGAVRHNGFIPWDDDLDVCMCRNDYEKLCKVALFEFKEPYFFQYALSDRNHFIGMARLRRTDTTGIVTFLCKHKYNNGIFIDIYVYDKLPNNKYLLNFSIFKIKLITTLMDNYYYFNNTTGNNIVKFLKPLFHLTKYIISYEKLYSLFTDECSRYNNTSSQKLSTMCVPYFLKYEVTQNGIDNLLKWKFENIFIYIPSDYDKFLTSAYGNYMKFPPVEERGLWHENIIIFDPDMPFIDYYRMHPDKFKEVIREYSENTNH